MQNRLNGGKGTKKKKGQGQSTTRVLHKHWKCVLNGILKWVHTPL